MYLCTKPFRRLKQRHLRMGVCTCVQCVCELNRTDTLGSDGSAELSGRDRRITVYCNWHTAHILGLYQRRCHLVWDVVGCTRNQRNLCNLCSLEEIWNYGYTEGVAENVIFPDCDACKCASDGASPQFDENARLTKSTTHEDRTRTHLTH